MSVEPTAAPAPVVAPYRPAEPTAAPRPGSRLGPWALVALLLLPVVAHTALVIVPLWREHHVKIDAVDLAVGGLVVAYLGVVVLVAAGRTFLARFALMACTVGIMLVIVEFAVRKVLPPPATELPIPPGRRVTDVTGDHMPGVKGRAEFTVNKLGLRGPEVNLADADLRILCVGGSTAECLYIPDKDSWPWQLQDQLAQRLGKKVFVGNAGKAGLLTPHHLYLLERYRNAPEFDCVVLLCGINDLGALVLGSRPFDARQRDAADEALTPNLNDKPYYRRLALVRQLERLPIWPPRNFGRVLDPGGEWIIAERQARQEALKHETVPEVSPKLTLGREVYGVMLRKIIHACRSRGQKIVLMTQPAIYRKDLAPELDRLVWNNQHDRAFTPEALGKMLDAFNQTMKDVCREEGVPCIDLAAALPKDTSVFYDDCHFNVEGCGRVAQAVTDYLAAEYGKGRR
jgi:lysophospholipase L1-like esterase